VRRLGFLGWSRLHRLVYPASVLGALHFFLRAKRDWREPEAYAFVLAALLAIRLVQPIGRRLGRTASG